MCGLVVNRFSTTTAKYTIPEMRAKNPNIYRWGHLVEFSLPLQVGAAGAVADPANPRQGQGYVLG